MARLSKGEKAIKEALEARLTTLQSLYSQAILQVGAIEGAMQEIRVILSGFAPSPSREQEEESE